MNNRPALTVCRPARVFPLRHALHHARGNIAALAGLLLAVCSATAAAQPLQSQVDSLVRASDIGDASLGLHITDLETGQTLATRNAEQPMIPASNMKLVTTAAALSALGPDHEFSTELRLAGKKLIVRGDGDPGFGDPELLSELGLNIEKLLDRWVKAAEKAGVEKFETIIVDDRAFDRNFVHDNWPRNQLHKWYCAPVAAINFNDNCLDVYATPTQPGRPPKITYEPTRAPIIVDNKATTSDRNAFWASRQPGTNRMLFKGSVSHALRSPIHVTIHDPPMFFAETLQRHLQAAGMEVESVRRAQRDEALPESRPLAVVKTTLPTVLIRCNRDSQNLFAEALFKHLGHRLTGEPGSWDNGAAAVRAFLTDTLGTTATSVTLDDGSGMSRANRLTTRMLSRLLGHVRRQPSLFSAYRGGLARPGETGTLERRFVGDDLEGQIYGKSGYLNRVIALSGYVFQDDRAVAFSMFLNDYRKPVHKGKRLLEKIVLEADDWLAEHAEPSANLGG